MSSWPATASASSIPGDLRPDARARQLRRRRQRAQHGMRRVSSPFGKRHQLAEHRFELVDQRDDAADDLPGEVLVALRQQHLREAARARARQSRTRALEEFVRALRPQRRDRRAAASRAVPIPRAAARPRAPMRSTSGRGLLDEIERAMRGLVGELDHVRQALARVRHFLVGEHVEARLAAEARAAPTAPSR